MLGKDPSKKILKEKIYKHLWKIKRTTSKNAMTKINEHQLIDETNEKSMTNERKQGDFKAADPNHVYIYIDFWQDRSF